ncbi:preprotein translocase subunit SecA [Bacilli bacterium PM5-3]|nr:preprotein translocase subunit SecA [Bacilli bacterium PM5-3]MDH6604274.1 preprotein translocase subunit SecA [Bacilli bacterium PM5-9]
MASFFEKLFSLEKKHYKKVENIAFQVDQLKDEMKELSDDILKDKTVEFKRRYQDGETLDSLLVEAFAVAREACYRAIGLYPFFVQIVGGVVMHYGDIAEMKTGEGKTLTSVMPAYLNALAGEGVHIVTVNDYLARRDCEEMGEIFKWLGLEVGLNHQDLSAAKKKEAYLADITYTTNSELGFDYLRDNMVQKLEQRVLRGLNFAIVDEVDSILIDESRTPLIISGGTMNSRQLYSMANTFAKSLKKDDYEIDQKTKAIVLTSSGIAKAEKSFKIKNIYQLEHNSLVHHINNALKANFIMHNDVDYLVRDGEVMIIDQFTGRIMEGRQYSDGLHQAIEAKEGVRINEETQTLATITYQNFFRLYEKLAGMTGTAKTEEEEFSTTYNMYVIEVPTNEPVIREDLPDKIFASKKAKFEALAAEVKEKYDIGQPMLIGTVAVETSEEISKYLKKLKIPHEILNAKNHEREAEIIAKAGQFKSVTIATNMAGRGTDIKLSDETRALGGLAVIGSERHESRRIDNQLRGRSGRQGDPGSSVFYLSFEDELLVRFAGPKLREMFEQTQGEEALSSKMLAKAIEGSQKRGEGYNFDIRKHLLEYDDVMSAHRNRMYGERDKVLHAESMKETVLGMITDTIDMHVDGNYDNETESLNVEGLIKTLENRLFKPNYLNKTELENMRVDEVRAFLHDRVLENYQAFRKTDSARYREIEKLIIISVIDNYWMMHIDTMSKLREGIHLRAYAQKSPVQEYREEGNQMFEDLFPAITRDVAYSVMNLAFEA